MKIGIAVEGMKNLIFAEFKPKERKNSKFIEFLGMKMSTIIDKI